MTHIKSTLGLLRLLSLLIVACGTAPVGSAQVPVRIMPLGDSITQGRVLPSSFSGGYRQNLYSLLTTQGFAVDFVGTGSYPAAVSEGWVDGDHEGHSGDKIADIRNELAVWLKQVANPDVILLHIGTNDFWVGGDVATAQNDLNNLLADLSAQRPHARIIVASLFPRTDSFESTQDQFNDSLPGIVSAQAALGRKVTFVDMHDGIGSAPENFSTDGVHPSAAGYDKMATVWLPAITNVITPAGTMDPPAIASVDARVDLEHVTVTFSKPIKDADGINTANFALDGVSITAASLDSSKRVVTLTTSPQEAGSVHTLTVTGVHDRMVPENLIAPGSTATFLARAFVNGSFEQSATGWTQQGSVTILDSTNGASTDGQNRAAFSDSDTVNDGRISQSVPTIPNQKYRLQFDMGVFASNTALQSLQLTVRDDVGGSSGQVVLAPPALGMMGVGAPGTPAIRWQVRSFEFTALSAGTTITFEDVSSVTASVDLVLDDVRLDAVFNDAPVAVNDGSVGIPALTVPAGSGPSVPIAVLTNDSDANNDTLTVTAAASPNGTVTINGGQTLSFTPAPGFLGETTISYTISDGQGGTAGATVWIAVASSGPFSNGSFENGPPVIFGAPQGWTANGVVTYFDLENYVPASGNGDWMAVFNPGSDAPVISTLSQSFFTVVGRQYTVTFDTGLGGGVGNKAQTLRADVSGETNPPGVARNWPLTSSGPLATWAENTFTFTAGSATTTLTFTVDISAGGTAYDVDLLLDDVRVVAVSGPNQSPLAVNDGSVGTPFVTVAEDSGTSAAIAVLANDGDPNLDPLTITTASSPNGSVVINAGATLSFIPAPNFNGATTISYSISDSFGGTSSATVFVAVTSVNDLPVAVNDGSVGSPIITVEEDSGASPAITVLGNDTDVDLNPLMVIAASSSNGTVEVNSGSTLSFTPASDFSGVATISYTISDSQGGTASATVFVTVSPVNDAPVAVNDGSAGLPFVTVAEDSGPSAAIAVLANDTDVDLNPLTVASASSPNGTVLVNSGTTLSYTPASDFTGVATISYMISDGQGGTAGATVFVAVSAVNDAPLAVDDGSAEAPFVTVTEDSAASSAIPVLGNDADVDLNPLTVISANSSNGIVAVNSGATLSFTPALNFNGATTISYTISDGQGGTASATVFVAVTPVNDPPVAVDDGSIGSPFVTVVEDSGASAAIAVLGNDTDLELDVLTVTLASSPDGTVVIDGQTTLSFTPAGNFHGATTISYTISDGQGGTASATVFVAVTSVNDVPLALDDGSAGSPFVTVDEDSAASGSIAVLANDTDADADTLTVTLAASPNGTVAINSGTTLSFTPAGNFHGATTISYTISDGQGGTASATVYVAVTSVNDVPVASDDGSVGSPFVTVDEDSAASSSIAVLANDTDADADTLTVTSAASPDGTVVINDGTTLSFTPAGNFHGATTISYTISDGQSGTASATVFVAVTGVNDAPVALNDGSAGSPFVTVDEDSPASSPIAVRANDTDVDLDSLTITSAISPNGTVDISAGTTLSFTPAQNFNGATTIAYTISDGQGGTSSATVFVAVTPVNDAPVAVNDGSVEIPFLTIDEDVAASAPVMVLGNDTDTDPDTLTVTLASSPNGVVVIDSGTSLIFTPALNFHGATTISYTISDSQGGTASATVFLAVTPVNDAPVAVAGVATVNEDQSVNVNLIASDVDAGDLLTYEVVSNPAHGSVSILGSVATYTPSPNYNGSDNFTFKAKDASLSSAETNVFITVISVDDEPVANDQSVAVNEDGTVMITLTGSDDGGGSLTFAVLGGPSHGSLRLNGPVATYTPDPNFHGQDLFDFIALDFNGGLPVSSIATVSITVNPVNDAPVAIAQAVSLNEDGALEITLTGTDPDLSDILTFAPGIPAHGTLVQNGPMVTYTPAPNYHGSDGFTFTVSDGVAVSPPAAVSITIQPVNDAPVAVVDGGVGSPFVTVDEDSGPSLPIAVLANDSDADLDALTVTLASSPDGVVVINPDQTLAFTPSLNFNGATTISYTISDGKDATATATAFIAVSPVNDAPVAVAQSVSVNEDGTLNITLAGSDLDADVTVEDFIYTVTVDPLHGSLAGVGRNRVYTPDPNFNGPDSFTFKVNDGGLDSLTAIVQVTVDPFNDAPVAVNDGSPEIPLLTVNEDSGILTPITVLGNDSDVDLDPLTVTLASSPNGLAAVNPDGTLSFSPALNFNGLATISYTISDGQGGTAVGTVFVAVTPVNDLPVAVDDGSVGAPFVTVDEDATASAPIAVLANDTDVDPDTLAVTSASSPNGSVSVDAATSLIFTPAADFNGATTISYGISDGQGGTAVATVFVFVTPVNDPPLAIAGSTMVNEDGTVDITLTGSDVDADEVLVFSKATDPANGTVSVVNGVATYVPSPNFNGSDSFTFKVNDGDADSVPAAVSITVTPVDDAPVANAQSVSVNEDGSVMITLSGSDVEGENLVYSLPGSPAHGTATLEGAVVTYTPSPNYAGSDSFDFLVSSSPSGDPVFSLPATVSIAVSPVSDAPVAVNDGSAGAPFLTVAEDSGASPAIAVVANDSDADSDPLAVTLATSPDGVVVINPDQTLAFTPNLNFNGATTIAYTISDGNGGTAGATVFVSVSAVNDAPVAIAQAVTLEEDGSLDLVLSGSDVDGNITAQDLSYAVTVGPLHGSLSGSGRNLTYTPALNYNGTDSITVRVNDGELDSTTALISISVNPVNDPPSATAGLASVNEDGTVNITLAGSDPDVDETLAFIKVADPAHGSVSIVNGVATYVPNPNFNGSDSFTFKANDGDADSAPATVSVNVLPVDDAPVANAQSVTLNEDGSLVITLTGSDADGDSIFFTVPGKPPHGNVALSGAAATYTPDPNYHGPDSISFFVYAIVSGSPVFSQSAAISITVTPVNDPPLAVNDGSAESPFAAVVEDSGASASLAVLGNDTDLELDALTVTSASSPNGTVLVNPDATVSFTPAENFHGATTIAYTISDGQGGTASATVFLTVTPVNDAPLAVNDGSADSPFATVAEDSGTSAPLAVLGNDSDADLDALTVTLASSPDGTVVINPDATVSFTPAANFHGATTIAYTISDGQGGTASATVFLTVTPVNDPPLAVNDGSAESPFATVAEDSSASAPLATLGNDTDLELAALTVTSASSPNGTVLVNPDATLSFTPAANFHGATTIAYTISDGQGGTASATAFVTVTPVNDAPLAVNDGSAESQFATVTEDSGASAPLAVLGNDSDADLDALTVTSASSPNGTVLVNPDATLSFTPAENFHGATTIAYTISDGQGGTASATAFVTVTPVNDAPVAFAQAVSLNEDASVAITLAGSDNDGDSLTYAAGAATHGTVSLVGSVATYTPSPTYSGVDTFTFTVTDGTAISLPATVSITVIEVVGDGFGDWLTQYSLTSDPQADSDHDSISNAVEYVIGGNPSTRSDTGLLPAVRLESINLDGNPGDEEYLAFTYRRTDLARDDPSTTIQVEWSTNLAGPWLPTTGMVEQVADGDGVDSVTVFIPRALAADGRIFTRLGVEISALPASE